MESPLRSPPVASDTVTRPAPIAQTSTANALRPSNTSFSTQTDSAYVKMPAAFDRMVFELTDVSPRLALNVYCARNHIGDTYSAHLNSFESSSA